MKRWCVRFEVETRKNKQSICSIFVQIKTRAMIDMTKRIHYCLIR